jgi:hypothetical protein
VDFEVRTVGKRGEQMHRQIVRAMRSNGQIVSLPNARFS